MLDLADHLPAEAAEALLELAVGKTPQLSLPAPSGADPFAHPDALRRFRVMRNVEELQEALEYPWEKWTIFLHPAQLGLVERSYNGPTRVSGSASTGKTVVALHRAAFLAKSNPKAHILLTTFSDVLANLLRTKLQMLIHQEVDSESVPRTISPPQELCKLFALEILSCPFLKNVPCRSVRAIR